MGAALLFLNMFSTLFNTEINMNLKTKARWELFVPLCPANHSASFPAEDEGAALHLHGLLCFRMGKQKTHRGQGLQQSQKLGRPSNEQAKGRICKQRWKNTPFSISRAAPCRKEEFWAGRFCTVQHQGRAWLLWQEWCHCPLQAMGTGKNDATSGSLEGNQENVHKLWD